ncbi:MAG: sialidase family protein [Opitutaceae bacterium]
MNPRLPLVVAAFSILGSLVQGLEMESGIVYHKEGRFAAWPANGAIWHWGNEILILHSEATYHFYPEQHSYDRSKPSYSFFARSRDGGKTWENGPTDAFSRSEFASLDKPMDFSNPDFAFRSRNDRFWYSEDRGRNWMGPFAFPDFGLKNPLTSRTDYLVDDENTLLVFLSAKEPSVQAGLQDRAFSARTDNGGLTWQFQGWMTGYPYGVRSVMPSTVRLEDHRLLSAVRRRVDAHEDEDLGRLDMNFIEAEYSDDNGRSWSKQSTVAFTDTTHHNGNPPALVRLPDGRVAVMYGFRGPPFGIRAKVSSDEGKTWGHEIILRDDGLTYDLGYPKAILLPDGRIFVCYYIATPERPNQHIAFTIWTP